MTLLESVLALGILALVAGVVLEVRAQSIRSSAELAEQRTVEREVESIFRSVTNGAIGEPIEERGELAAGGGVRLVWLGEHLGEPFEVRRRVVRAPNPVWAVAESDAELSREVAVFEYEIEYRGERSVFLYHR